MQKQKLKLYYAKTKTKAWNVKDATKKEQRYTLSPFIQMDKTYWTYNSVERLGHYFIYEIEEQELTWNNLMNVDDYVKQEKGDVVQMQGRIEKGDIVQMQGRID